MFDQLVNLIQGIPPEGLLLAAFILPFVENLFPPSPSDILLVFVGSLLGESFWYLPASIVMAMIGSTLGFAVMYVVGRRLGDTVTHQSRFRWISASAIEKTNEWFKTYGYWIIVINRFLSGTRAVISVMAGMSKMNFPITLVLSAVSALVWNAVLLITGKVLGSQWRTIGDFLSTYSSAITPIVIVAAAALGIRWWYLRNRANAKNSAP